MHKSHKPIKKTKRSLWDEINSKFVDVAVAGTAPAEMDATKNPSREMPVLHENALYGLVGDFIRLIDEHTEADKAAMLIQFLVLFGNIIGRKAHFKVESTKHYLKLFAVVVGQTAKARKGVSFNRVLPEFQHVDPTWADKQILSGLSSGEGLIAAVRDEVNTWDAKKQKMIVADPGVQDKRLVVVEQEFASVLKVMSRETNTLSTLIRQAWDSGNLRTLTKNNPYTATESHISIIGHITAEELMSSLRETDAVNGFGNRFLWIYSKRSKYIPFGSEVPVQKMAGFRSKLRSAINNAKNVGKIDMDDEAARQWDLRYRNFGDGPGGLYGALTARPEAQIRRIACIYALLDGESVVRLPHLDAACAVWDYADATVAYVFGDRLGNATADNIYEALQEEPDGLTTSQLHALFARKKSSAELKEALEVLAKKNLIFSEIQQTPGRSITRWFSK